MRVWVTVHAAQRFEERVRPGMSWQEASRELARLVELFGEPCPWPEWAHRVPGEGADRFFVEISDGIVVVCEPSQGPRLLPRAVTVLTRGGHGVGHEGRGTGRRARRRARRLAPAGPLARQARSGRRDALAPGLDEAA